LTPRLFGVPLTATLFCRGGGEMLVKLGQADVRDGELRSYEVADRFVLVTRLNGQLHALDDLCNHAGCLLSGGWLEQEAVVCPCHEFKFDLATGANVTVPKLCDDQTKLVLNVEGGELFVELPDSP
jgi:3-phenylpropionate/trans-cinnamate dioxygenase ferredoxin subunit